MLDRDTFNEAAVTLKFGFVTELDEQLGRVRCRIPDMDDLETWWLPVLHAKTHRDQHWRLPDVGEHVALLLDARGETGVVLGAIFSQRDTPPVHTVNKHHVRFDDATWVEYDRAAHKLTVSCRGDIEIVSDTHIALRAPRIDLN
ncbi:MAG: phage baseplate assembly protein V [Pseudomonadota bacterium]